MHFRRAWRRISVHSIRSVISFAVHRDNRDRKTSTSITPDMSPTDCCGESTNTNVLWSMLYIFLVQWFRIYHRRWHRPAARSVDRIESNKVQTQSTNSGTCWWAGLPHTQTADSSPLDVKCINFIFTKSHQHDLLFCPRNRCSRAQGASKHSSRT